MKVKYNGKLPAQANPTDAGYDLCANAEHKVWPGQTVLIKTGFKMQMPPGYCADVRSRSGLALKSSVYVLNAPGTVDCTYTGDVGVIIHNGGDSLFNVRPGDRIAQLVFIKVEHPEFEEGELDVTDRGSAGFGSTGVSTAVDAC